MSTIVEFHERDTPEADMVRVQDAHLVVICHGRGLYTVWKDRDGRQTDRAGDSRVSWADLHPEIRKAIVDETRAP